MKAPTGIILGLSLFLTANIFGQTNRIKQQLIYFLDRDSQTNLIVIRNGEISLPCPPKYTNLLSNTNLFSSVEQKLIPAAFAKYKNYVDFTTNSGPTGTKAILLYKTNYVDALKIKREDLIGVFRYTNSVAQDEITFGSEHVARHWDKDGGEYEVRITDTDEKEKPDFSFIQMKQGVQNGLCVGFSGDGHCLSWMRFTNGLAIGKWLEWERDNGLSLEVEFKLPYDYFKHIVIPSN